MTNSKKSHPSTFNLHQSTETEKEQCCNLWMLWKDISYFGEKQEKSRHVKYNPVSGKMDVLEEPCCDCFAGFTDVDINQHHHSHYHFQSNPYFVCLKELNPIHFMFRNDVDECFLRNLANCCICTDETMSCCCNISVGDIINGVHFAKLFWRSV